MTAAPTPSAEPFTEHPPETFDVSEADPSLRRCVASGAVRSKAAMIRFVVAPDGALVPDLEESLPGRGLWLTADRALAEKAFAKGLFAKAARRGVTIAPDLLARTEARLAQRCFDAIGLTRRAGQAVAGFDKVAAALRAGRIGTGKGLGVRLEASDGADDGRAKLDALARGLSRPLPVLDRFSRSELGAAFGRDDSVHVIIGQGNLVERLIRDAARLSGLGGNSRVGLPND